MYRYSYLSPLGSMTMASDGESLTGLWFDDQKHFGTTLDTNAKESQLPVFVETESWLDVYFNGKEPDFMPEIKLSGTDFQLQVWELLRAIPYGKVATYKDISIILAKKRGIEKMSARAVGTAVGRNPISIIVPCHRVVGINNKLTGYAGGIDRKEYLLKTENFNSYLL